MKISDIEFRVSGNGKKNKTLYLDGVTIHLNELDNVWDVRWVTDEDILNYKCNDNETHPFYKNKVKLFKESKDIVNDIKEIGFIYMNKIAIENNQERNMTEKELKKFLSNY